MVNTADPPKIAMKKSSAKKNQKRFWCILDADIHAKNEREAAKEFLRLYGIHSANVRDILVEDV
jgi:hypothetical protein